MNKKSHAQTHDTNAAICPALSVIEIDNVLLHWGSAIDTLLQLEALFKAISQAIQSNEGGFPSSCFKTG